MNTYHLEEPLLEFARGRHVDVRFGIAQFSPYDRKLDTAPSTIRVGIVGTQKTVDGIRHWLEETAGGVDAKETRLVNLFPPFPGLGNDNPFHCRFEVSPTARRVLPVRDIGEFVSIRKHAEAVGKGA